MGKGFRHDPLADIELIRQNLKDRYGAGLAILKELIQNADDAGATLVEFAWTPGINNTSHPLLQGPGLVALNDGRFTPSDREAIQQMGLSDKLRERESIGKFGLGLKSVFHWCEAFVYLAKSAEAAEVEGDVLNPWSGESGARSYHSEWDDFSDADRNAIVDHIDSICPRSRWFCLWIPLRRARHCRDLAPIQSDFPGDQVDGLSCLKAIDLERNLASQLPLLATLEFVRVSLRSPDCHFEVATGIHVRNGAQRRHYRRDGSHAFTSLPLHGEIESATGEAHSFCGQEALIAHPDLTSLKDSILWPRGTRADPETGQGVPVPEKADPHAAAVFVSHPATDLGGLAVAWAAFLPIGDPVARIPSAQRTDYTLLLHGDFFVDPGRNRPDFGVDGNGVVPANETELRRRWNRRLAQLAVIPQVLPALKEFSQAATGREEVADLTRAVTQAFDSSMELEPWHAALCREYLWAYCLEGSGGIWRLLPARMPLLGIPGPPAADPCRPSVVFPALEGITRRHHVTIDNWPRITPTADLAVWPEDTLLEMLEIDAPSVFATQTHLDYLAAFLAMPKVQLQSERVQQKLRSLARRALLQVSFDTLKQHRHSFLQFIQNVSSATLLRLVIGQSAAAQRALRALLELPLHVLPVPSAFLPTDLDLNTQLRADDAMAMLRALSSISHEDPGRDRDDAVSCLAIQILQRCRETRREVLEHCQGLRLFKVHDCRQERAALFTLRQLRDAEARNCLFTYGSQPAPEGLASFLQEAIGDGNVLLVYSELGQVLFGSEVLPPCSPDAAASAVLSAPSLAPARRRVRLLQGLLAALNVEHRPSVLAARYLLHGDHGHINDMQDLLLEGYGVEPTAWTKLADQSLQLLQAGWRLVPECLSTLIPGIQRQSLRLRDVDAQTVARLLWEAGPEQIHCEQLAASERDQVIRDLDDVKLLQALAIHPDRTDQLRAIDSHTFLESDFRVDEVFTGRVTILRRSLSSAVQDKQRRLAEAWTPRAAIRVALDQPLPHEFAQQILDALRSQGGVGELADELKKKLKEAQWLPARGGTAFAPEYVLHIEGMEDDITPLAAASRGAFADLRSLAAGATEHQAFRHVTAHLVPAPEDVLTVLGDLVKDSPALANYRIGPVKLRIGQLEPFIEAFQGARPGLMPGLTLFQKSVRLVGELPSLQRLLPGIAQRIPAHWLADILSHLVERYKLVPLSQRQQCLDIHALYLRAVVDEIAVEIVPDLRLLNARGQWQQIQQLCSPTTTGIDNAHVVDQGQFEILRPLLDAMGPTGGEVGNRPAQLAVGRTDPEKSAAVLKGYFRPWEDHCPRAVIAGFLSFLGDGAVRSLAQVYFGNRGGVDLTRGRLRWRPRKGVTDPNSWAFSDSPLAVISSQRFHVSLYDPAGGTGVRVHNILGLIIHVPPQETFEHLLIGDSIPHVVASRPIDQLRESPITLRVISPDSHTEQRLSQMLRETARLILKWVYLQDEPNLDEVWTTLHEGEQKDIHIAQIRVVESLFLYVRQLGLHHHTIISDILGRWDQAQRQRAEAEALVGPDGARLRDQAEIEAKSSRAEFQRLLDGDDEIQQLFLQAVRERIERHYQYRSDSIPFELFQNADDAAVELGEMLQGLPVPPESRQFHLAWGPNDLSILHWGRPINSYQHGDFNGRTRGFDADLEKMLVLAASDKGVSSGLPVTGRFGLGFKSVFLFADRAEVVSGRLAFEVVGGLFPRRMPSERHHDLHHGFDALGLGKGDGTLIHLPTAGRQSSSDVIGRFRRLVHLLLVFSRVIKCCGLHGHQGNSALVTWEEFQVPETEGIVIGHVTPVDGAAEESSTALVFRLDSGAILLHLGPHGFRPVAADIPNIWVTAPTDMTEGLGFALNAAFDLDVGRAQLASRSEHNYRLADELGAELGPALRSLARRAELDWPCLAKELGLSRDARPYDFWDSLWSLFARRLRTRSDESEAVRVVRSAFWGQSELGMVALIIHHDAIPTGLPGGYQTLTRLDRVSLRTQGCLDERSGVFERVSQWPAFLEEVHPGSVVSGEIAFALQNLTPFPIKVLPIRLSEVLTKEVGGDGHVDPVKAASLGAAVTRDLMDELRLGSPSARVEHEELLQLLGCFKFRTRSGSYRQPSDLVVNSDEMDEDEVRRARFAPASQALASEYDGPALSLFQLCRGREQPRSQDLARWILEAIDQEAKVAALQYLVKGKLNLEIAAHLRGRVPGTWLADLQSSALMLGFTPWERSLVLSLLGLLSPPPPPLPPPPRYVAKDVLEKLHAWWLHEGASRLPAYVAEVYPGGLTPALGMQSEVIRSNLAGRKEWLQLFLLGASFTLGGVQREQHRAFVQWCDDGGWLDACVQPAENASAMMMCLRDYLERGMDRLPFYYWLRLFVPMFQLSTWLDEYVWIFLQLERQRLPVSIHQLLSPNTNPLLTGTGVSAPPLGRTLGVGACFVLRELARRGVLTNQLLDDYCYVPSRAVRWFLRGLGCPGLEDDRPRPEMSKAIHAFVSDHLGPERARFDNHFDIPLLLMAEDPGLQAEVLHETIAMPEGEDPDEVLP